MNILVTGARAPICADIVRALLSAGHRVWTSDSMLFPVGRFSPGTEGYVRLPAPRIDFQAFSAALVATCARLGIERIIPTSEEVFWLSAVQGLPATCVGVYPPLHILGHLHNKQTFAALAVRLGYGAHVNRTLQSKEDVTAFAQGEDIQAFVFKPVYSRFASEVLVSPTLEQLAAIAPSPGNPWLAQSRAVGQEFCVYNVAVAGELILHTAYQPRWRAGKGAGVYFEPVENAALKDLSDRFIKATNFTGQICFDVIETANGPVALECNPRGTSGVHLAAQDLSQFAAALVGETSPPTSTPAAVMLALPHAIYNSAAILTPQGRRAWRVAKDAMAEAGVPLWGQLLAVGELLIRTIGTGKDALATSTADTEWNGELIHLV